MAAKRIARNFHYYADDACTDGLAALSHRARFIGRARLAELVPALTEEQLSVLFGEEFSAIGSVVVARADRAKIAGVREVLEREASRLNALDARLKPKKNRPYAKFPTRR